ncbi:MAG: type II toxin-antitoxin system VapC family toxin [Nanoarchaeota archaeon]
MIGIDTGVLIDLFRENESLRKFLEGIDEPLVTTIINYQEIFFGINPKKESFVGESNFYNELFSNLEIYQLDKFSSDKSSNIFWYLNNMGKDIGKFDSLIAGILLANGIDKIITKNAKHFENVKGLKVLSY